MEGVSAHLLRDAKYVIDDGDTAFRGPFRRLLPRAISRRQETPKDTTPKQYLHDLERRLDLIITAVPVGMAGHRLRDRILANRGHLLVFITRQNAPATNNASERHLHLSVIFGDQRVSLRVSAETYAAFRPVVSIAKANHVSVYLTIWFVLSAKRSDGAIATRG